MTGGIYVPPHLREMSDEDEYADMPRIFSETSETSDASEVCSLIDENESVFTDKFSPEIRVEEYNNYCNLKTEILLEMTRMAKLRAEWLTRLSIIEGGCLWI